MEFDDSKKIDKDSRIYFGIDNLFNHRDDDRALSARGISYWIKYEIRFRFEVKVKRNLRRSSLNRYLGYAARFLLRVLSIQTETRYGTGR